MCSRRAEATKRFRRAQARLDRINANVDLRSLVSAHRPSGSPVHVTSGTNHLRRRGRINLSELGTTRLRRRMGQKSIRAVRNNGGKKRKSLHVVNKGTKERASEVPVKLPTRCIERTARETRTNDERLVFLWSRRMGPKK